MQNPTNKNDISDFEIKNNYSYPSTKDDIDKNWLISNNSIKSDVDQFLLTPINS